VFRDARDFAFAAALERHWREVYDEYRGVAGELEPWVEDELYEGAWNVFPLFTFPHGAPIADRIARCPRTAELVDRHFARHGVAGFSVLGPGARVRAHQGYQGDFLRCHLGLRVPPGDCAIEVGGAVRRWEDGKVLVFDDRETHAAWNATDAERVILLVDFVPDA
jgi:aspartyl/asparaginyl beta-hydroxylase (cupin superfamily)